MPRAPRCATLTPAVSNARRCADLMRCTAGHRLRRRHRACVQHCHGRVPSHPHRARGRDFEGPPGGLLLAHVRMHTLTAAQCEHQVCFNPQGSKILTASSDKTARLWDVQTGDCLQVLEGHTDEIFSCAFNYEGDTVITGA